MGRLSVNRRAASHQFTLAGQAAMSQTGEQVASVQRVVVVGHRVA